MNEDPGAASNIVAEAVDRGINYFDIAPSYGNAQERLEGRLWRPIATSVSCLQDRRPHEGRLARASLRGRCACSRPTTSDLYSSTRSPK